MSEHRLGDVIDDHCIKCRRVTNHSIVSLVSAAPAKVRCRTCYHDHDYRFEQAPPSKKELKRLEMLKEGLIAGDPPADLAAGASTVEIIVAAADESPEVTVTAESSPEATADAPKKGKGRKKA